MIGASISGFRDVQGVGVLRAFLGLGLKVYRTLVYRVIGFL